MATTLRLQSGDRRSSADPLAAAQRRLLATDPTLPRTLIDLVLDGAGAVRPRPAPPRERVPPAVPHRLPPAIANEMPPNILYRRYPLVASLLVELDELRRAAPKPIPRRGR